MAIELKVKKSENIDANPDSEIVYTISPKDDNPAGYPHPINRMYRVQVENRSNMDFSMSKFQRKHGNNEVYKEMNIVVKPGERKELESVILVHAGEPHPRTPIDRAAVVKLKYMIEENGTSNLIKI